jgi:hypothetical protein
MAVAYTIMQHDLTLTELMVAGFGLHIVSYLDIVTVIQKKHFEN